MTLATIVDVVPPEIRAVLDDFAARGKTGVLEVDIKDGRIMAYKITEHGRIKRIDR